MKSSIQSPFFCLAAVSLLTVLTACEISEKSSEPVAAAAQSSNSQLTTEIAAPPIGAAEALSATVDAPLPPAVTDQPFIPDLANILASADVSCDADASEFNSKMLEVVNGSRVSSRMCGVESKPAVGVVVWNDKLEQAARAHARDMATNNFFSHDGSDGLGVAQRADTALYEWRAIGENIAAGQLDIAEVQQGWLDSPGHCLNIMSELYTEVGAACVSDPNTEFGTYWVVVFGDAR